MSEFERIARLKALFERPSADVTVAIGDDCAVLAPGKYPRVWTVDVVVEGVHFERAMLSLEDVGYRAFMAAGSDLAAMGARGVAALSSLVLPRSLSDDELDALARGLLAASDACRCPIVGGNLARGAELSLTTSVLGECEGKVLTRAGARAGDQVYVTGVLGAAALGLSALLSGQGGEAPFASAVQAWRRPRARLDLSAQLAASASAAIDVSDGLVQDLMHLCRASGVAARIELARVPTLPGHEALAALLGVDPALLVAMGGEDYEVLFTAPAGLPSSLGHAVGSIQRGPAEVVLVDVHGEVLALPQGGFDHFR